MAEKLTAEQVQLIVVAAESAPLPNMQTAAKLSAAIQAFLAEHAEPAPGPAKPPKSK